MSAFRYHADLTKTTLYTTGFPCHKCAALIVQSGVKTVVYSGKYKNEIEREALTALNNAEEKLYVAEKNLNEAHIMDEMVELEKIQETAGKHRTLVIQRQNIEEKRQDKAEKRQMAAKYRQAAAEQWDKADKQWKEADKQWMKAVEMASEQRARES